MSNELWQAKASVIAAFAGGPGIMIDDERERDHRIANLLALVEMEFETPQPGTIAAARATVSALQASTRSARATVVDINHGEIRASNSQINWNDLIDHVLAHPGKQFTLLYDKFHTAVVTASRQRTRFSDVDFMTERRGDQGAVILTAR